MNIEYEGRILNINVKEIEKKLKSLNAVKKGEFFQRRYIYDFNPIQDKKWIRLRTNGKKCTLTIKNIKNESISGTNELEIEVDNFDKTNLILNELGYKNKKYQENKRITYYIGNVEIDIDSWPLIPTYIEIEGKNEEEVIKTVKLLGYDNSEICTWDVEKIYKFYGININNYKNLKF